jgi:hypothetical protein
VAGNPDHTTNSRPVHTDTGEVRPASGDSAIDRHDPAATATGLDDAGAAVGAVVATGTVIVGASASVGRGVANDGSDRTDGLAEDTGESTADRSSPSPQPATNPASATVTSQKHRTAERGGVNPPATSEVWHRQVAFEAAPPRRRVSPPLGTFQTSSETAQFA